MIISDPSQQQQQQQQQQQMTSGSLTLPRPSDKVKLTLPLSPLAAGVTVTNSNPDTLTRPTKYVTRPNTPVTPKSLELTSADLRPAPVNANSYANYHTYDPSRSRSRSRYNHDPSVNLFAVRPPPTFVFPEVTTWHASLPRLVRHQNEIQVRLGWIQFIFFIFFIFGFNALKRLKRSLPA